MFNEIHNFCLQNTLSLLLSSAMSKNKFFIDAEFPDWDDLRPISVGVISETGESLYFEINEGWKMEDCSEFVIENVLPLLEGGNKSVSLQDARRNIYKWILSFCQHPTFVCDSHYDIDIFKNLLPALTSKYNLITFDQKSEWELFTKIQKLAFEEMGERSKHHALNDAKALRKAYLAVKTKGP